ncbi:type VI secretion system tube protein TssD [Aquimarina muelleri]|uniref:type VI secretion system tube protein TssD n=1 Tax=Aquimarina muelleri TaxID=279356 RepID=UPI003F683F60
MGILAKLTIFGQVRELQNCTMLYQTLIDKKGKPAPMVLGGLIECTFITGYNEEVFLYFMQMPSIHNKKNEDFYYLSEGEVVFYFNSFDNPPLKRYKFNDAAIVGYREVFTTHGETPMLTTITISPAIQDYGYPIIRRWNKSYIPPSKQMPYRSAEVVEGEPEITESYYEDLQGNTIPQRKLKAGDEIYYILKTTNATGKEATIDLANNALDYEYNGAILQGDLLTVTVTADTMRLSLKAITQQTQN